MIIKISKNKLFFNNKKMILNSILGRLAFLIFIFFGLAQISQAGLTCSVTTSFLCSDVVVLRMSSETNAHAELPDQTTAVYDDNVVCCSGITGLGNSCSGNFETFVKLSSVTNAHVEQVTESNYNYNACLASSFAGDEISVGYQSSNCDGYDTTLFSMSNVPTNSQVGIPSSYNNKVCASVSSQSLTFNISDNSIGFGNLNSSGLRYATGDGSGSSAETEAFYIEASTNASSGYNISVSGSSLSNGLTEIDPIGGTNLTPSPGTKSFGIRAEASGGSGVVSDPYSGLGFAYDANGNNFSTIAEDNQGDGITTTYSIRAVATIDSLLEPGNYTTDMTYIVTANF